jgi:hypothetical protein
MARFFTLVIVVSLGLIATTQYARAAGQCYCRTDYTLGPEDKDKLQELFEGKDGNPPTYSAGCVAIPQDKCSTAPQRPADLPQKYAACDFLPSVDDCNAKVTSWNAARDKDIEALKKGQTSATGTVRVRTGLIEKILPACIFKNDVSGECRNVSIFIKVAIDITNVIMGIVGALALIVFVYGGFVLILSEGSSEKVSKGTGAMMAAVIGLTIVFAAYLLIRFLGQAFGVKTGFGL